MRRFREKYFGDADFYKMVFVVAIPIMIQNGITNFVNMLDNIMIGQIGTESMTGVSIVNQILFVYNLCVFGAVSRDLYSAVLRSEKHGRHTPYSPFQAPYGHGHYRFDHPSLRFLRTEPDQFLPDRRRQCREHKSLHDQRQGIHAPDAHRASLFHDHTGIRQHIKRMRPDAPAHESRRCSDLHQPVVQLSADLRKVRLSDAGRKRRGDCHRPFPRDRDRHYHHCHTQKYGKEPFCRRIIPESCHSCRYGKEDHRKGNPSFTERNVLVRRYGHPCGMLFPEGPQRSCSPQHLQYDMQPVSHFLYRHGGSRCDHYRTDPRHGRYETRQRDRHKDHCLCRSSLFRRGSGHVFYGAALSGLL